VFRRCALLACFLAGCGRFGYRIATEASTVDATSVDATSVDATSVDATSIDAASRDALLEEPFACAVFVNDDSASGDVLSGAVGSDANTGERDAPFRSLSHALSRVEDSGVVCVDTGVYPESLEITRSVKIVGVRRGVPACGRRGAETLLRGRVTVQSSAAVVTLDGLRLERSAPPEGWAGVNVVFASGSFELLHTHVVPSRADGGYERPGIVARDRDGAALVALRVEGNAFGSLPNDSGVSAVFVPEVLGAGEAVVSDNCFSDSSDGGSVYVWGHLRTLRVSRNEILNTVSSTAGGIALGPLSVDRLFVADNRIENSPRNGITVSIAGPLLEGVVTGNIVHASGLENAFSAAISVVVGPGVLADIVVRDNDVSRPAGGSLTLRSEGAMLRAPCNWFGTSSAADVARGLSGSLQFIPFLIDGTDTDVAQGFQPRADACTGR
jgi:hypothetical protein